MHPQTASVFDLPVSLAAKAAPDLVAGDEAHFDAIAASLRETVADLTAQLDAELRAPGGHGEHAMNRDQQVRRLTNRLRTLQRFGLDLCLGHLVRTDGETVYVGRLGLTDGDGRRLLVDWRSPVAEPFFGATHGTPMGLARRRRYRWTGGRIRDYWDEVFTPEGLGSPAALDDQSAFIASLGTDRSPRMRDVLGTIQSDQDAIIRAGSSGALVVDGGPGTGKTVVALHRSAYLLHSDPRLGHHRGGVLFIGPHQPYLDYVSDVLPSLGEEGVRTCTLGDLVPEGQLADVERDPVVAGLKASAHWVDAIERAVAFYEEPPKQTTVLETDWDTVRLTPVDWAEAFAVPDPGTPHNEARSLIWDELLETVVDRHDDDVPTDQLRAALERDRGFRTLVERAWPLLDASDVVGDLWSVPAYLRMAAPWLSADDVRTLQRSEPTAWTRSDLPLLDLSRRRLGDRDADGRVQRNRAILASEQADMDRVVEDLIAADDSDMHVMSMLRRPAGDDPTPAIVGMTNLVDTSRLLTADPDVLAGPFAHVVVDEAQELTDAEWQMLLVRCPSRSFTVVGDRAQARHGFTESWSERLERVGLDRVRLASLTVNYRTPEEVMVEAEPVIRAALPDANVPTSIRRTGVPVRHGPSSGLDNVVTGWLTDHPEGIGCVIGDSSFEPLARVRSLTPELAKGLEFDLVVLVEPDRFGTGIEGAVDRYVAMTRATQQLVVLTGG